MEAWFQARVKYHQLRRSVDWIVNPRPWARRIEAGAGYPLTVAERTSLLQRSPTGAIASYCEEKTHNLRLAATRIDGCVVAPGEVFSFCRLVGQTTARRGYKPALELHDGNLQTALGGGLCQLANLLFLLAIDINAEIVERHRHSFDLFRDVDRTVPFACGATVFYNYVDFQFANTLDFPVQLHVRVEPPHLVAGITSAHTLPFQTTIVETDHRFFRRAGQVHRANRLWKEIAWTDGRGLQRELLFENECRVLYDADDLVDAAECEDEMTAEGAKEAANATS